MARRGQYDVYKKGAIALIPVLVGSAFTVRSCVEAAAEQAERDALRKQAEVQTLLDNERQREAEASMLEQRARARAVANEAARPVARGAGTPVATAQHEPDAIAADATHVYWLNDANGDVMRAPREGGAPTVLASKQSLEHPRHAQAIAVDDASVYWLTSGARETGRRDCAVLKAPKTGGELVAIASEQLRPASLVVHGRDVFWVRPADDDAPPEDAVKGAVMKSGKGGKPAVVVLAERPCGLAADKTHLYFIDQGSEVMRVRRSGGEPEVIVSSSGGLGCSIAVDDTSVYWISRSEDALMKASKTGDGVMPLAFESSKLSVLAADKTHVYSITESMPRSLDESGSVWRVSKDGSSPPVVLAAEEQGLNGLAASGADVFWTRWSVESASGAVMRLPK